VARYAHTAILIIIEGQFQVFQRISSSKVVLRTVESRYEALNYYENSSTCDEFQIYQEYYIICQSQSLNLS
jgi:hypothetical protein